jgi:adenylate cyclase
MGDTVNLASRIEGLNKFYGTEILLSHSTWQVVREVFEARLVDVVAVKGKTIPVRIYELLGERGAVDPVRTRFAAAYEKALELYFARRFAEAAAAFALLVTEDPADRAASVLHERCRRYESEPPPSDWQGEHVLEHK